MNSSSSASPQTERGACALCNDINAKSSINCMSCGARLPWADDATAQMRAAKTPAVAPPTQNALRPAPSKSNAQFYLSDNEKPRRSAFENLADLLMPASGLIVIGLLVYFMWFRATGGMTGRAFSLLPIGVIGRFIVNKLFDD